jgi:ubiquinone/menaquinone biosynthesis C-methylase UbiE
MAHVCPAQHVKWIDNFARLWVHNPQKMFAPFVKPGMRVLDVGCGGGFASLGLARLVGEQGQVFGVDLQPAMLEVVRERATKAGLEQRIFLHKCTENDLSVQPAFDFINAFYMVHEVPDQSRFLAQICSLLSPSGQFFMAEPKFHVSADAFTKTIETAITCGLKPVARPSIRFSHAAVFTPA